MEDEINQQLIINIWESQKEESDKCIELLTKENIVFNSY